MKIYSSVFSLGLSLIHISQTHLQKTGTPTMGGLSFLAAFAVSALFMTHNHETLAVILVTLGFGLIGFVDDYIKVVKKRSLGLKPMQKIVGQLIICALFIAYLYKSGVGTEIYIPFAGGKTWDLGILFIPFCIIAVLATVNGVNLTDGLDGLADGVTLIVAVFFTMCAYAAGSGIVTEMCIRDRAKGILFTMADKAVINIDDEAGE